VARTFQWNVLGGKEKAKAALRKLWNCTDIVPGAAVDSDA
jgi:hypothetical protein